MSENQQESSQPKSNSSLLNDFGLSSANDTSTVSAQEAHEMFNPKKVDEVREYWNRRPCNLRHSNAEVGTMEYFNQVEARKYYVEPHIPGFAQFERWNGKKVLEIGCGIGTDSINFARAGADLTVVELSDASLELCKQRFQVFGLKAKFFCGDAEHLCEMLPEEDLGSFDLIYSFGVIHHTPTPKNVIANVVKLLKPETGEFRFMVYSKISFKLFWVMKETGNWDFSQMDALMAKYSEAQTGCPVTYTYTFEDIANELLGKQFKVLDTWKDHIFTFSIPEYRQFQYVKEPMWANVSEHRMKQLERELGWHTMCVAKLVTSSSN